MVRPPFGTATVRAFAVITDVARIGADVTLIRTFVVWGACGPVFAGG